MASIILPGNATPAQVLAGQTFSAGTNYNVPGTMPNQGSPTLNPGQAITAGYYGGGNVAAAPHGYQFYTTPGSHSLVVPVSVTVLFAFMVAGGGGCSTLGYPGAWGAVMAGLLNVTPGTTASILVGAAGVSGSSPTGGGNSSVTVSDGSLLQSLGGGAGSSTAPGQPSMGGYSGANAIPFGAEAYGTNQYGSQYEWYLPSFWGPGSASSTIFGQGAPSNSINGASGYVCLAW